MQIKALLIDPSEPILIIEFLAIFELTCDTNRIHEEAAMQVPFFFVKDASALTLDKRMSAATKIRATARPVYSAEPLWQGKLFWPYLKVINYILRKFLNDHVTAKIDIAILHFTHTASVNLM